MKCVNKFLFADPSKGKQLPSREAVISGIRSIGHKSIISKTQATDIAWADVTWNPIWGCTQISEGCDNCYAKKLAHGRGYGGPSGLRPYLWGKDGETETGPTWDVERGRSITRPSGWAKLDALNRKAEKNNQVIVVLEIAKLMFSKIIQLPSGKCSVTGRKLRKLHGFTTCF